MCALGNTLIGVNFLRVWGPIKPIMTTCFKEEVARSGTHPQHWTLEPTPKALGSHISCLSEFGQQSPEVPVSYDQAVKEAQNEWPHEPKSKRTAPLINFKKSTTSL